jgi:tRNA-binding EMAP/Myf-like protein
MATAVSHDGSPVPTALTAVRGALAERRLVVTGVPNLSALAGVRARTIGVTLSIKSRRINTSPSKSRA